MPRLVAPTVEPSRVAVDTATDRSRAKWFAIGLFAAGLAIGAALVVAGAPLPPLVPVLVLALFVVVAVNRFVFFPTEIAVTAEAAVLVAAIVAFRHDSALVGPWCIAFLTGPLDLLHWRQRSFVRMAYNAGNRMIATLAGAAAFTAVLDSRVLTPGGFRLAAAALGAAIVFASVEGAVGVVLVRLHTGQPWRAAARIELPLDALSVPLGIVGAAAGYLATEVGWWAAALLLLPTLFVPELALAPVFRRAPAITRIAVTAVPAVVAVVVLAFVVPLPATSTLLALVAIAVIAGFELRVDLPVPPVIAALVAAAVVVSGDAVFAGAAVAAVVATAVARVVARQANWWAPLYAGGAALAAAAVYDGRPSRAAAIAGALLFELVVVAGLARVLWTAPLICVAVALGDAWRAVGGFGAVLFAVGLAAVLVAMAVCGAPPWGSRRIGPRVGRHHPRSQRAIIAAFAGCSLAGAVAACALTSAPALMVALASASAAAVGAMAMSAVRQWRFAPRPRARDAILVLVATTASVLVYPALARSDDVWSVVVLAGSLAVLVTIAWPLARLAASAASVPQRMPDRRSASA
jgi:hypothetical protein